MMYWSIVREITGIPPLLNDPSANDHSNVFEFILPCEPLGVTFCASSLVIGNSGLGWGQSRCFTPLLLLCHFDRTPSGITVSPRAGT